MSKNIKIYLIGNPNVGKTTIFNKLTGKRQQTGNYIGTTVDAIRQYVQNKKYKNFEIYDVAGVYNYEDKKDEECIAWKGIENAMMEENVIFVQVVNNTYCRKSLSLTLDLQLKGIRPILFFNTRKSDKKSINHENRSNEFYKKIEKEFHVPVFMRDAEKEKQNIFQEFFFQTILKIVKEQKKENNMGNIPKIFESVQKKNEYIENIFEKNKKSIMQNLGDKIFLHSFFGILIFFFLLYFVFEMTFTVGAIPMDWIDLGVGKIQEYMSSVLSPHLFTSFIVDGIIGGVGGTLIFLPNIVILFFFLSILKETGYLSRTAFLFDVFFQKIGVSGKASVPLLMGFGCNVPAVMAIKSFETRKEQIIVAMMSLFMSCGARLPVYTLLLSVFIVEKYQAPLLFGIYILGMLVSFATGKLLSKVYKPRENSRLKSYEMPSLEFPNIKKALVESMQKAKLFIVKAGTFILPATIVLWGLFTFPQAEEHSYGSMLGKTIAPIFSPMEFDWKISTALLSGIAAKEVMVTTFSQLYNATETEELLHEKIKNSESFSFPTMFALIVFVLLYTPCIAVVGVIRSELGNVWAVFSIVYPFILAWIMAFITFKIANFLL